MEQIKARTLFQKATGFIQRGGFDWTCNPYVGCTFGCLYCYAAYLPQNDRPLEDWGKWFRIKKNAIELAEKETRKLAGQSIYMSSVTDPYQPIERKLMLTRGILEASLSVSKQSFSCQEPRWVIQTRGPMVVRDIDLLTRFSSLRVNLSIPTDHEEIAKLYEPKAPSLDSRWRAAHELQNAGVAIGICVTPTLPLKDPIAFADRLLEFRPEVLVTQPFHERTNGFGANTSAKAVELLKSSGWSTTSYQNFVAYLKKYRIVYEGEDGFFPPD